jgi:hypothetical protein
VTDNPLDLLRNLSYQFHDAPETGYAMARLEIRTPAGMAAISIHNVKLGFKGGIWTADYEDAGIRWHGESEWTQGAILALLADRIGFRAAVTIKPEPEEEPG